MIRRGWSHGDLMAMSLNELGWWIDQQHKYDMAEAKAIREASKS